MTERAHGLTRSAFSTTECGATAVTAILSPVYGTGASIARVRSQLVGLQVEGSLAYAVRVFPSLNRLRHVLAVRVHAFAPLAARSHACFLPNRYPGGYDLLRNGTGPAEEGISQTAYHNNVVRGRRGRFEVTRDLPDRFHAPLVCEGSGVRRGRFLDSDENVCTRVYCLPSRCPVTVVLPV